MPAATINDRVTSVAVDAGETQGIRSSSLGTRQHWPINGSAAPDLGTWLVDMHLGEVDGPTGFDKAEWPTSISGCGPPVRAYW
jgi:hypothetical protein